MKTREIEGALLRKGFQAIEKDHTYYYLYYKGKLTNVSTKISHGESEIRDPLIAIMSKQLKLSKNEFQTYVACTLGLEKYYALLIERGVINPNN